MIKYLQATVLLLLILCSFSPLKMAWGEMGEDLRVESLAYPAKTFTQLIAEYDCLVRQLVIVGGITDHSKALIASDMWRGSVQRFLAVNHYNSADQCIQLKVRLDSLMEKETQCTNAYMRTYDTGLQTANYETLRTYRNWQDSAKSQRSWDPAVKSAWMVLCGQVIIAGFLLIMLTLLQQGMLWQCALKYSAYVMMSCFSVVGSVGVGVLGKAYAQTPTPKTEKKVKQVGSSDGQGSVARDGFVFNPRVTYGAVELLISPQVGPGQIEVSPQWVLQVGSVGKTTLGGFGFVEVRSREFLNFFQQGLDVSNPKWKGFKVVSSAGFFGKDPHASVGIGISLKDSPVGKSLKWFDSLQVSYLRGMGAAAKNEVVFLYALKPIPLVGKFQLVILGFYRAREWNSLSHNFGQPQLQVTHPSWKRLAFTYECEIVGKSATHLFGVTLKLK